MTQNSSTVKNSQSKIITFLIVDSQLVQDKLNIASVGIETVRKQGKTKIDDKQIVL